MDIQTLAKHHRAAGHLQARRTGFIQRNVHRLADFGAQFKASYREKGLGPALAVSRARATFYISDRSVWLLKRAGIIRMKRGILFIGYVEGGLGLGESLRNLMSALSRTSLSFALLPLNRGIETRNIGSFMPNKYDTKRRYSVNVIEIAADQVPALEAEFGAERFTSSYNILRTYWELPRAPASWAKYLERIDEIWAPTIFVAEAFKPLFGGRITIVPPCVDVAAEGGFRRSHFGMDDGRFYFLFSFDYYSRPARKNPLAVLDAFRRAFPTGDENVGLIIKTTGAPERDPGIAADLASVAQVKAELAGAAQLDARILLFNRTLQRGEMLSLIKQSDCYVSLHRSEGFGLGMAEAMAFGNAVIGTDFSGSRDFLSEETGFPIPCTLRPVRSDEYFGGDQQVWAEPDKEASILAMRRVYFDRETARKRGLSAAAFIAAHYGSKPVALTVEDRLRAVMRLANTRYELSASSRG